MFKKCGMCLFLVLCIILCSNCLVYGQGAKSYGYDDSSVEIGAIEFYTLLVNSLAPEKIEVPEYVDWCNPQMRVLVNMNLLEPIDMVEIENGYYSAASFIDRGLGLIGYIQRPIEYMGYIDSIELLLNDLGIRDKFSPDLTKKMTIEEACNFIELLKEMKKSPLKKLVYEDNEAFLNYEIDSFVNSHETYRMVKASLSKVPEKYLNLLNNAGYKVVITDSVYNYIDYDNRRAVSSMMSPTKKLLYFTPLSFLDIFHEVGHVVSEEVIPNSDLILEYLYNWESKNLQLRLGSYSATDKYEYFACLFDALLSLDENNKIDKMTLDEFRKLAPLSTHFIYDIVISADSIYDVDLYNKFLKDNRIFVNE